MIDNLLEIIAPHHCYVCQKCGDILCDSCVYNIKNEPYDVCLECRQPSQVGKCVSCSTPYSKSWLVGERKDELAAIIDDFKWYRMRSAYKPLARLLHETLPLLPSATVVVPIPTISKHIRIRGYDHACLIAKEFARLRQLDMISLLKRKHISVQHTAGKKERIQQADQAFYCDVQLDAAIPYLVVDDIITTGATIKAATRVLKNAGAREVWVAAIARQPFN